MNTRQLAAFTLIELSIVIVIIGLIVAGIVAGQSLVKQAQLRTVVSDINKFRAAISAFRVQYDALPGDMKTADSYFSACVTDPNLSINTCNGNGNGHIRYSDWSLPSGAYEGWRAFEHMHHAGLLELSLTNLGHRPPPGIGAGEQSLKGVNIPEGSFGNGYTIGITSGNTSRVYSIAIGAETGAWVSDGGVFTPTEAYSIDNKVDDGIPDQGKWTSYGEVPCRNISAYVLSSSAADCSLNYHDR